MNLEMIESMWKEDSKLDDEKLDHDSLAIPRKHAKYLQLLNQVTMLRDEPVSYTHLTLPTTHWV